MSLLAEFVQAAAHDFDLAKDELTELDALAGDGDLGITASSGAAALVAILPELERLDAGPLLRRIGTELAKRVPSTGGTLVASGFLAAGRAATPARDASASPLLWAASLVEAAERAIEERGKAEAGEKTMLDALGPAAAALGAAANRGLTVCEGLAEAAGAASKGAEATRDMLPRHGRASWLAARSTGNVDAGARMVAILFASMARSCGGHDLPGR